MAKKCMFLIFVDSFLNFCMANKNCDDSVMILQLFFPIPYTFFNLCWKADGNTIKPIDSLLLTPFAFWHFWTPIGISRRATRFYSFLVFLGRAVARAPISGFVSLPVCLSVCPPVTVSFWRGFESSHWV